VTRAAARCAAVLAAVLAVLLGLVGPASAADDDYAADHVLVIGVPGLTWSDLGPQGTPNLWQLAGESSIGALSVRAARGTSCLLDGWATLGAGNRARFPGADELVPPVPLPTLPLPDGSTGAPPASAAPSSDSSGTEQQVDASLSHCGLQEQVAGLGLTQPVETVQHIAEDEATARFGAEPGVLGSEVGCATVIGRAASVSVARDDVDLSVTDLPPADPAALTDLLGQCRLTLASVDALTDAGRPGVEPTDTGTSPGSRAEALAAVDATVGRLRAAADALPGRTLVLVAGISEVGDGRPQLHVVMADGPGFGGGWLTSSSTGRAPFSQLIDVAPTVLRALGLDQPASMNGEPVRATGARPALTRAVRDLELMNVAASVHYRSTGGFFWTLVLLNAAVVLLGLLVLGGWRVARWRRAPTRPGAGSPARRGLRVLATAVAAVPVSTYLSDLVPWEHAGSPRWALAGAVLGVDLVVTAVVLLGPWRRRRTGPPLALLAITLATLLGDVLTGSNLEMDGLLGYDAIVAGRFTGYGNLTFGLLATSGLLLIAALAAAVGRRVRPERERLAVAATVLGCGLVLVGVDGAPQLGRDFGGVLGSVPGVLLLAMLLTRTRVTVARLAAILGAAVVAVATVAYLDWLRPADEQTHLGRFVGQVLSGEAWTVVSRKGQANLDILLGSTLSYMLPVALVAAWWLVRPRGGLLRGRGNGLPARDAATLRAGLLAVALSLTIGAAVNDSGVAVPATAAALLVPLLVWLAAAPHETDGTSSGQGSEGDDRVTVVSRGSTAWNA